MTTITVEVTDELAERLAPLRHQLPELLSLAVELYQTPSIVQRQLLINAGRYPLLEE